MEIGDETELQGEYQYIFYDDRSRRQNLPFPLYSLVLQDFVTERKGARNRLISIILGDDELLFCPGEPASFKEPSFQV